MSFHESRSLSFFNRLTTGTNLVRLLDPLGIGGFVLGQAESGIERILGVPEGPLPGEAFIEAALPFIGPTVATPLGRGLSMGFFSRLVQGAGRLLGGLFGGGAAPAAAVAARPAPAAAGLIARGTTRGLFPALGGVAAGGALLAGGQALLGGDGAAIRGGNGMRTTFTVVTTVDNDTGQVIAQRQLRGSPFLMNADLVTFKRVGRSLRKGARRAGVRAPRQSTTAFLTEQIQEQALKKALFGQLCPTGSSHENKN